MTEGSHHSNPRARSYRDVDKDGLARRTSADPGNGWPEPQLTLRLCPGGYSTIVCSSDEDHDGRLDTVLWTSVSSPPCGGVAHARLSGPSRGLFNKHPGDLAVLVTKSSAPAEGWQSPQAAFGSSGRPHLHGTPHHLRRPTSHLPHRKPIPRAGRGWKGVSLSPCIP